MNNIAIIYHDADWDGKLSNEVCRHWLRKIYPAAAVHSYGWDYGRPVPAHSQLDTDPVAAGGAAADWSDYDAIYIVDLSIDELMERPELRSKIVWIDHHKSAIEKWDIKFIADECLFDGYRIDGVAACRLCWQWFSVGDKDLLPDKGEYKDRLVSEPELIRLAGEYDIWDHRDPDAKPLQFGLRALSETDFGRLVQNQFNGNPTGVKLDDVITQGRAIKFYCDKQNFEYATAYAQTIKFEGLTFCALNIGQRGNSDLFTGAIKPEHDALFAWRWTGEHVLISLYHAPGREYHDLSTIAVKYGGGGHRGACGFRTTLLCLNNILSGIVQ